MGSALSFCRDCEDQGVDLTLGSTMVVRNCRCLMYSTRCWDKWFRPEAFHPNNCLPQQTIIVEKGCVAAKYFFTSLLPSPQAKPPGSRHGPRHFGSAAMKPLIKIIKIIKINSTSHKPKLLFRQEKRQHLPTQKSPAANDSWKCPKVPKATSKTDLVNLHRPIMAMYVQAGWNGVRKVRQGWSSHFCWRNILSKNFWEQVPTCTRFS